MVESVSRRTTIDQRIVRLLRVGAVAVSTIAFLTIVYLVGWVGKGGITSLIDLNPYSLGRSTAQYPVFVYDLNSATLEILEDKEQGRFVHVHILDRGKYDGFGVSPVPGAGGADARLVLRWRGRSQLRSVQVAVREGTEPPNIQPGETFSTTATPFPATGWTVTEIPIGEFELVTALNPRPGPMINGLFDPGRLKAVLFTFPPSSDIEIDVAGVSMAWRGYNWFALLLLPAMAAVGLILGLRPFDRAVPVDSGALLSTSTITRTAFILVSASALYLVYQSDGWLTGGPLLLHIALLALVMADEFFGGDWSYHRWVRFRYLGTLIIGWYFGVQMPVSAWLILSVCAYLPALQYDDQIMTLAVPLIGLAGYLLGTYPKPPSMEIALIALAASLLLALLFREVFRHLRTSVRTEERLQQSEANYQAIFHAVSEGMLVVEPVSGLVLEVNEAAAKLLDRTSNELKTMRVGDLIPSMDVRDLASEQESPPPVRETEIARRNADAFSAEVAVGRVLIGGKPRALVVIRDIDRRKRLEEQLRESQKMEAVGQLAGGVAHDFNNLLTVVNCQAELALERVKLHDPLHQSLLEIHTAGVRAADLVSQLLAYSRRQMLQPRPVDLRQILTEMQETLTWMGGGAIELILECKEPVDRVMADRRQIEQVIVNLAENSLDAMASTGGKLTVSVRNRVLSETEASVIGELSAGHYVELRVVDSGEGMDRETLSHLFEPFFTTKEMGKGTGLGLSTVYGIVRQHHGAIQVYSTIGHGTTFCVLFPRSAQAEQAQPAVFLSLEADS